jgi:hypothetical protein
MIAMGSVAEVIFSGAVPRRPTPLDPYTGTEILRQFYVQQPEWPPLQGREVGGGGGGGVDSGNVAARAQDEGNERAVAIEKLVRVIKSGKATKLGFLYGAGVSVNAGIPDFRSAGGMYVSIAAHLCENSLGTVGKWLPAFLFVGSGFGIICRQCSSETPPPPPPPPPHIWLCVERVGLHSNTTSSCGAHTN